MPGLEPAERFDVVLFGCNTFAHLLSDAERHAALAALRGHLRPGGALLLDLDVAGMRHMAETMGLLWLSGTWPLPGHQGETLAHFSTASPGSEPGTLTITHLYDVWGLEQTVRRTVARMSLAVLDAQEVERLLTEAGYHVRDRYGSYELTSCDEDAPRAIFVASA